MPVSEVVSNLTAATDEELSRLVDGKAAVVAHFWAPWNAWDRVPATVLFEASHRLSEVCFVGVCIDHHGEMARKLGLMSIPGVALWRSGSLVEFWEPNDVPAAMYNEILFAWFAPE